MQIWIEDAIFPTFYGIGCLEFFPNQVQLTNQLQLKSAGQLIFEQLCPVFQGSETFIYSGIHWSCARLQVQTLTTNCSILKWARNKIVLLPKRSKRVTPVIFCFYEVLIEWQWDNTIEYKSGEKAVFHIKVTKIWHGLRLNFVCVGQCNSVLAKF